MCNIIPALTILNDLDESNIFCGADKYVIPLYQRAFAWGDKEISQLIEDIRDFKETKYYIGSLIVDKKKSSNTYEVIDGQQRLTALFLLLNALGIKTDNNLFFDCREKSNYTLKNIKNLVNLPKDERLDYDLLTGLRIINDMINTHDFDKDKFKDQLKKVLLYRIKVPQKTDLNRYFEIMNTRGEQLEQHDILKANLMSAITTDIKRNFFATIWGACSDMTGYVQMHFFDTDMRKKFFGENWQILQDVNFEDESEEKPSGEDEKKSEGDEETPKIPIADIMKSDFPVETTDEITNDGECIRFESIISFPHFLLHTLKIFVASRNIVHKNEGESLIYDLLDDKKLLHVFNNVIDNGTLGGRLLKDNRKWFSLNFIKCLLKCRFLFDKHIIKREYKNDNLEGEWSLKELNVSGQGKNKKPYFINTNFGKKHEWESTYAHRTKTNLMLQACLRVSYTSPKVMHWITHLLKWLYEDKNLKELDKYEFEIENIGKKAVKKDFLEPKNFSLGVNTPHIVFNYLDYLLWKEDNNVEFDFEFRNSVEHWYPQHPTEGTFEKWTDGGVDNFGNLCIVHRNVNSKFSNLSPDAKKSDTYKEMISKGSMKLRIMAEKTEKSADKNASQNWKDTGHKEHGQQMIKRLEESCTGLTYSV